MNLGKYSYIADHRGDESLIDNPYGIPFSVGRYTCIAKGLTLVGVKHNSLVNKNCVSNYSFSEHFSTGDYPSNEPPKGIHVFNDVLIGAYVTLADGITIGNGAIIKTRSVVYYDVPDYAVMFGNPCELIGYRFKRETISKLLDIKWWDWEKEEVIANIQSFKNVDDFIERQYAKKLQ